MEANMQNKDNAKPAHSENRHSMADDVKPVQAFVTKTINDWVPNLAGILAYNLVMLMVPISLALLALLGVVLGQSSIRPTVIRQVTSLFPGLSGQQNALDLASQQLGQSSGILGLLAVLSAIFFGSLLFVIIEQCLDIIYRVRPRPLVRQFLVAIGVFIIFIILIPLMVFASAAPSILFSNLANLPFLKSIPGGSFVLISLGGILGALIAAFLLFEVIYLAVPNQKISFRNSWPGAVCAAIATEVVLTVFPLIIRLLFGSYAGPIGFAVILLLFFYVFSMILLLGAEVNASFFEGVRPIPNDLVTFLSTMAGKLNKDIPAVEAPAHVDTKPTDQADDQHIDEAHENRR